MTTKFDELMLDPEFKKLDAIEGLIADTAQMICDLMERKNLKQADLARMLGKTPAFVSQLLNGKANMTIHTLAEVIYVLGGTAKIKAVSEDVHDAEVDDFRGTHTFRMVETNMSRQPTARYRWSKQYPHVRSTHSQLEIRTEDVA